MPPLGHALELDDSSTFSIHPSNPLTAAALALGEKLGSSGREVILAWMAGWEVTAQTSKPCENPGGHVLLQNGWHPQGFQPALGVAALCAKLMGFDVMQTRMALGNAATAMGGLHKNKGRDTKSLLAGNAAMHGVTAAEMTALGFTANEDILDGDAGVARLLGREGGDPQKVLDGLGSWDMATKGSSIKIHACCGAGHWGQDALQKILRRQPVDPDQIESIEVHFNEFLGQMVPYTSPQTGLEGKFSIEYDLTAIALDGRAGLRQYTDEMVKRPQAQALMKRVIRHLHDGAVGAGSGSRVVVTLKNGNVLEETVKVAHGTPADPLSVDEINDKFHECAGEALPETPRDKIIDLCWRLESLDNVREIADAMEPEAPARGDGLRGKREK